MNTDFQFPSAREMAWPISLAAFAFSTTARRVAQLYADFNMSACQSFSFCPKYFCFRFSAFRRKLAARQIVASTIGTDPLTHPQFLFLLFNHG